MRWLLLLCIPLLAGCTDCEPNLEIRHCLPDQESCSPAPNQLLTYNETLHSPPWSDFTKILQDLPDGEHYHEAWTQEQFEEYDAYMFAGNKDVYFEFEDEIYRVRLLRC